MSPPRVRAGWTFLPIVLYLVSRPNIGLCDSFDNSDTAFTDSCSPEHVHIAYGETVFDIVVLWATNSSCTSEVLLGKNIWDQTTGYTGTSVFYPDTALQYIHRVILHDLDANTTYYYKPQGSLTPFYFRTPLSGNNWSPDILVYGDLGVQSESFSVLTNEATSGNFAAILHIGDFAYNMEDEEGRIGDKFMQKIQSMASMVPYMTSPGNHECNGGTFSQYRYRFSMPQSDFPIPLDRMWYSLNIGPIHFVSYSSEVFFSNDPAYAAAQHDWLMSDLDLANQNRDKQPWVIAYGHRPMYCSSSDGDDCTLESSLVSEGLEDLFYSYGVDLVLQGHEHLYERLYPMFHNVLLSESYVNPKVPVQIITGAAGSKHGTDPIDTEQPDWCAVRMQNESYPSFGRVKVYNSTHLYWEQIAVEGRIILDYIWIIQESHGPFSQSDLPEELRDKVQKTVKQATTAMGDNSMGNNPSMFLDGGTEEENSSDVDDPTVQIAIGTSFGVFVLLFIIGILVVRKIKKKPISYRRWDTVDYGRKFYSNVQDADNDTDDFEVDVTDGTLPTTKLLADGQTTK